MPDSDKMTDLKKISSKLWDLNSYTFMKYNATFFIGNSIVEENYPIIIWGKKNYKVLNWWKSPAKNELKLPVKFRKFLYQCLLSQYSPTKEHEGD